jgi:NADH-quinone oxidoreductase subunit A
LNDPTVPGAFLPVLVMAAVAVGFVAFSLLLTHLLGPKRRSQRKLEPFECGAPAVGDARVPFAVKYFLVAILFVLFDVEVVFMYPWAVAFRELGTNGLLLMIGFSAVLVTGFVYVVKKGALQWEE